MTEYDLIAARADLARCERLIRTLTRGLVTLVLGGIACLGAAWFMAHRVWPLTDGALFVVCLNIASALFVARSVRSHVVILRSMFTIRTALRGLLNDEAPT